MFIDNYIVSDKTRSLIQIVEDYEEYLYINDKKKKKNRRQLRIEFGNLFKEKNISQSGSTRLVFYCEKVEE